MNKYLGIIIRESLKNHKIIDTLPVISKKEVGSWQLLLVSIDESELKIHIKNLQDNMMEITKDCWYAHYFCEQEIIVVFQDRIFYISMNQDSWDNVIEYGINNGIPREQLDFKPHV